MPGTALTVPGATVVRATDQSVAAAHINTYVGELHQHHQHEHAAARSRVSWPHQVGVIPPRAGAFQDRAERARLREAVAGGGTAVLGQADRADTADVVGAGQVLSGMGGVGKTQLAADLARTVWAGGELDLLVWVTAVDRSSVVAGLGRAGVEVTGADPGDPQAAAEALVAWLEPKTGRGPCRWLVVLDDVADPADLEGLWPPASPYGRTLITTRRRDAAFTHDGRTRIEVGLFTPTEAHAYLSTVLAGHGRTEPAEELAGLAADLGWLPLALSQAAAFMADADMACAEYRALLADRGVTLADASPQPLPPGHARAMAAAWELSVERADTMRPVGLARPLLHLAAFLDPNGIPAAVLTAPPALAYLGEHHAHAAETSPGGRAGAAVSAADIARGLRVLHRLSLIDHTPNDAYRTVRVHALIQRAIRDTLTTEEYGHTARTAADSLLAAWPEVERDTNFAQALRASTTTLTACAETALHHPDAHPVLFQAGLSLGQSGQVTAAIKHYRHLAATTTAHLGPDHADTLTTRDDLAYWQGQAGDAAGAAAATADLLNDRLRVSGPDHPHTLSTRGNLAYWQGQAGDAAGAAAATADLLNDRLRVLGPDHPDTLTTRDNLARWRWQDGDPADAAAATADLLNDRLRVSGPDHPHTLITRCNLAYWQGQTGDTAGAAAALADLLQDMVRVLGPDHPHTLTTRHNLVYWRGQTGDPADSAAALADLLQDTLRALGPDHPNTLTTRHNLAYWQGQTGDTAGAAADFADLLQDMVRVLGPDHPDTLNTRDHLAHWQERSAGPGTPD